MTSKDLTYPEWTLAFEGPPAFFTPVLFASAGFPGFLVLCCGADIGTEALVFGPVTMVTASLVCGLSNIVTPTEHVGQKLVPESRRPPEERFSWKSFVGVVRCCKTS